MSRQRESTESPRRVCSAIFEAVRTEQTFRPIRLRRGTHSHAATGPRMNLAVRGDYRRELDSMGSRSLLEPREPDALPSVLRDQVGRSNDPLILGRRRLALIDDRIAVTRHRRIGRIPADQRHVLLDKRRPGRADRSGLKLRQLRSE